MGSESYSIPVAQLVESIGIVYGADIRC